MGVKKKKRNKKDDNYNKEVVIFVTRFNCGYWSKFALKIIARTFKMLFGSNCYLHGTL